MRYMIFPPLQRSLWCLHAFAQFWLNSDLLPGPIHCGTTVNAKPGSTIEEELAQSNRPGTWPTLFWLGCVAWQVLRMSHKLSCHERCFGQLKASVLSFRACKSLQPRSTSTYSLLHMFVISLSASSSSVSVSVVWWYQPYQWKPLESHLVHQISPNIFFARSMIEPRPGGRGHYQAIRQTFWRWSSPCKLMLTMILKGVEKRTAIYWNLGWWFTINNNTWSNHITFVFANLGNQCPPTNQIQRNQWTLCVGVADVTNKFTYSSRSCRNCSSSF